MGTLEDLDCVERDLAAVEKLAQYDVANGAYKVQFGHLQRNEPNRLERMVGEAALSSVPLLKRIVRAQLLDRRDALREQAAAELRARLARLEAQ